VSLFNPGRIGTLEISNRLLRSASHEGLADARGAPTDAQFQFYKGFTDGGIGLIITGYAGIQQNGKSALYHMTMIDSDELIPAHNDMVERLHAIGGKIVLQIAHCGRQTSSKDTGAPDIVAPSPIRYVFYGETPRELTEREIYEVIDNFAQAARRAKEAGYDGVQVHGAHGYLLASFLSRAANRRTDQWGGSAENRFRIVRHVLRAVKVAVGTDYPVLIKLNSCESAKDGIRPEECVHYARMVEATECCDAIEISAGANANVFYMARGEFPMDALLKYYRPFCAFSPPLKLFVKLLGGPAVRLFMPKFLQGYNLETAAKVKQAVGLPVITVGGMRDRQFMDAAIKEAKTDFISIARPLLLEPDLANKFRQGASEASQCDNCNICLVASDTVSIRCHKGEFAVR
jgi:2,4-dienoyl-CoA reductase-like NADH-dependent reductase (Old Yellow Enzyme family)